MVILLPNLGQNTSELLRKILSTTFTKDIDKMKSLQKRAAEMVGCLEIMPSDHQLTELGVFSQEKRG